MDDRRGFDAGEVDDADAVTIGHGLVCDVEAGMEDDAAVVGGLLVPGDHDPRSCPSPVEVAEDLGHERLKDGAEVLVPEAGGRRGRLGNPDGLGCLDGDIEGGHGDAPFERSEVGFDTAETGCLVGEVLLDLGLAQQEHAAQLLDGRVVVEHWSDLLQGDAKVSHGEQSMQTGQLCDVVEPVSGLRVDPPGPEQADLVVVPKHPGRDLPEPCELSDGQHDTPIDTASHDVKVKTRHHHHHHHPIPTTRSHHPITRGGTACSSS
jgi:hypothetical protein